MHKNPDWLCCLFQGWSPNLLVKSMIHMVKTINFKQKSSVTNFQEPMLKGSTEPFPDRLQNGLSLIFPWIISEFASWRLKRSRGANFCGENGLYIRAQTSLRLVDINKPTFGYQHGILDIINDYHFCCQGILQRFSLFASLFLYSDTFIRYQELMFIFSVNLLM